MKCRKGFTLIELMVVVLIVAILAAVLVPLLTARIESARWTEGKAGAGTIATAVRAYAAEYQESGTTLPGDVTAYVDAIDLLGKYFNSDCYSFAVDPSIDDTTGALTYTIQVDAPADDNRFTRITQYTLDHTGTWSAP